MRTNPNADYVKSRLDYNHLTGDFYWKPIRTLRKEHRTWNTRFAGKKAGSLDSHGYLRIALDGIAYKAQQLAWVIMTGEWCDSDIDHMNQIPNDNRWRNLRKASPSENRCNSGMQANNTSGYKGVSWDARKNRWRADIKKDGQAYFLGQFRNIMDAKNAYDKAAKQLHGDYYSSGCSAVS